MVAMVCFVCDCLPNVRQDVDTAVAMCSSVVYAGQVFVTSNNKS